jgi:hypothetical protein
METKTSPDETRRPVSDDDNLSSYDTPTQRAVITQLTVDELDAWLTRIRARRLQRVQQLERVAQVRADQVRLTAFLKLEKAIASAKRALAKLDEQDEKTEKLIHKCRLLAMAAQLEVGMEEDADTAYASESA